MTQMSLFGPGDSGSEPKPHDDQVRKLRLITTVKAAPNPSEKYGETVCVAGLSIDPERRGWIRLYPINFRHLASEETFKKYDIISISARPAHQDPRRESWRPIMDSIVHEGHLDGWNSRRPWLDEWVEDSMCELNRAVRERSDAPSLALVRPRDVGSLRITPHDGWTPDEQRKINSYVSQLDLLSSRDRTPLEAPRFRAAYAYRCESGSCKGHRQHIIDWELVALQRRFRAESDDVVRRIVRQKFLEEMCAADRETAFYVGNQAKRLHVFSVLGTYWPRRR